MTANAPERLRETEGEGREGWDTTGPATKQKETSHDWASIALSSLFAGGPDTQPKIHLHRYFRSRLSVFTDSKTLETADRKLFDKL